MTSAARYPTDPKPNPFESEPTPMYDALMERSSAKPRRLAYLRDRLAQLSGGRR